MAQKVSIVILCYNKVEFTRQCISALCANTPAHLYELIVVDNASHDQTGDFLDGLAQNILNLKVIRNKQNLGFVGGNNQAAKAAQGEYLVFLNNDTEPQPGWLEGLVRILDEKPQAGAVGAKLIYPDGRLQEAGGIIFSDATGCNWGKWDDPNRPEYNYLREVDYCSGACLMVRRSLFENLGGFDERFAPAYYEDTDLCFSIRTLGYKVYYQPESKIIHYEGATAGTDISSGAKRFQEINRPKFIKKWGETLKSQYPPTQRTKDLLKAAERLQGKQVLFAHTHPPFFDRAAGAFHQFNLMRILVEHGQHVTFVCQKSQIFDGTDLTGYVQSLQRLGVLVYGLDNPPCLEDTSKTFDNWQYFLKILQQRDYDAAYLPFYYVAEEYIPVIRQNSHQTLIVVDSIDVHFLREARRAFEEEAPSLWVAYWTEKQRELKVYNSADRVTTVTAADQETLSKFLPDVPIFYLPIPYHSSGEAKCFDERKDIVFIGGFKHLPNIDAVLYFYNEVWPLVQEKLPDVRWYIVGDSPPDRIRELACDNIIVTGYVSDLEPYLQGARLNIAPLTYGAGMKGKVATGLSHGLPCVSTPIGAEGMGLTHGKEIWLASTPQEFADGIEKLYTDPITWKTLSEAGMALIDRQFGDEPIYSCLKTALALEQAPEPVSEDLTSMLNLADAISRGYEAIKENRPNLAEAIFTQCLSAGSNSVVVMTGLAMAKGGLGSYSEADAILSKALKMTKHPANLYVAWGHNKELQGNIPGAQKYYEKALGLGPDNEWVLGEFAAFAERQGNLEKAKELYQHLAQVSVNNIDPFFRLAAICGSQGDDEGYLAALENAYQRALVIGKKDLETGILQLIQRHRPVPVRTTAENEQNAAEVTFQLLLEADDLAAAIEQYADRLDDDLLTVIRRNAQQARESGDLELAEGLEGLDAYIQQVRAEKE